MLTAPKKPEMAYPYHLTANETVDQSKIGTILQGTYKGKAVAIKVVKGTQEEVTQRLKIYMELPWQENLHRLTGLGECNNTIVALSKWHKHGPANKALIGTEMAAKLLEDPKTFIQNFALPTARGLAALEEWNILHRQLQSKNVLVSDNAMPIISEWTLAEVGKKELYRESLDSGEKLPIRWLAPESFAGNFSHKSDVWQLAVMWSEILNQDSIPYRNITNMQVIAKVAAGRLRPKIPDHLINQLPIPFVEVFKRMLASRQSDRPGASEIVRRLEYICERMEQDPTFALPGQNDATN
mmetsp:Transcript_21762/g.38622  ORF Transcript_21762/g.38622 Transcript_21762/m.38622 type:complete len:297 (-) Transcript_21762:70-960(-)